MTKDTHSIVPLFAVPLYVNEGIKFSNKSLNYIKKLDYKTISGSNGKISLDNYILNDSNLIDLKNIVETEIENYVRQEMRISDNINFYLCNSWVMKHTKGHRAPEHFHGNSIISGIMYLQCDDKSGDLTFSKPGTHTNFIHPCFVLDYDDWNINNSLSWTFRPRPGDIFLFPSFLYHRVAESLSDNERYCIAFNIFIKGDLGIKEREKITALHLK
jgi:uncharacterized protein (TIGR02466 family)